MPASPLDYLRHIRDEARYLAEESARTTKSHFDTNETTKRAFVRSIEIIGEATKKVPGDLKQRYPHIDWRGMTGMRDKLIHDYFGVDYDNKNRFNSTTQRSRLTSPDLGNCPALPVSCVPHTSQTQLVAPGPICDSEQFVSGQVPFRGEADEAAAAESWAKATRSSSG